MLDSEVRGIDSLKSFGDLLFDEYVPEWEKKEPEVVEAKPTKGKKKK